MRPRTFLLAAGLLGGAAILGGRASAGLLGNACLVSTPEIPFCADDRALTFGNLRSAPDVAMTWETTGTDYFDVALPAGACEVISSDPGTDRTGACPQTALLVCSDNQALPTTCGAVYHDGTNAQVAAVAGGLVLNPAASAAIILDPLTIGTGTYIYHVQQQVSFANPPVLATLFTVAITAGYAYSMEALCLAWEAATGDDQAQYYRTGLAFRTAAGPALLTGQNAVVSRESAGAAGWDEGWTASTPNMLYQVVGNANEVIDYHCRITILATTNAP